MLLLLYKRLYRTWEFWLWTKGARSHFAPMRGTQRTSETLLPPSREVIRLAVGFQIGDVRCPEQAASYKNPRYASHLCSLLAVVQPTIIIGDEEREKLRQKMMKKK